MKRLMRMYCDKGTHGTAWPLWRCNYEYVGHGLGSAQSSGPVCELCGKPVLNSVAKSVASDAFQIRAAVGLPVFGRREEILKRQTFARMGLGMRIGLRMIQERAA